MKKPIMDNRHGSLQVKCPRCGSKPNVRCMTKLGASTAQPHRERVIEMNIARFVHAR